jgi:hypothetical protein
MKTLLIVVAALFVMVGLAMLRDTDPVQKPTPITNHVAPTPAEKRAQERKSVVASCNAYMESIRLYTYSELSISQRGMKAACEGQLQYPDLDIIKADAR